MAFPVNQVPEIKDAIDPLCLSAEIAMLLLVREPEREIEADQESPAAVQFPLEPVCDCSAGPVICLLGVYKGWRRCSCFAFRNGDAHVRLRCSGPVDRDKGVEAGE